MSLYISVQVSAQEKAILDAAVEDAKRSDPLMNRNRLLRNFIATLQTNRSKA